MLGFRPNAYTLSLVLSLCSGISSLGHGKQVHGYIIRLGYFQETSPNNALITLYAKCGVLDWSCRVFDRMVERDIISWNAIISAYAQHGGGNEAVCCFEALQGSIRIKPDKATFTAVLSACSRAGLVDDGMHIFISMVNEYKIEPGPDHISCVVDLLSRAGYLSEAEKLIDSKHLKADSSIWWALFSACASFGDLRLGRIVARFLLENEKDNPTVYVQLANIYAAAEQWEEAASVRELMEINGVVKQPGWSWIR